MKLTHITTGQAGVHASNHQELTESIAALMKHGYAITDIADDAAEPWHAAIVHYTGNPAQQIRTLKDILGLPYPGKK